MTAPRAVCLRCDWTGPDADRACPVCGVELYLASPTLEPPASAPRHVATFRPNLPTFQPLPRDAGAPELERDPGEPPEHEEAGTRVRPDAVTLVRRGAPLVTIALLVLAAVVGRSILDGGSDPQRAIGGGRGTLVYAAEAPDGTEGLWALDLATGRATRGAEIDGVSELLRIEDGRSSTSIGVTRIAVDGRAQALAFAGFGVDARPDLLVTGDRVAWGPRGRSVSAASTVATDERCTPAVRATAYDLVRFQQAAITEPGEACGQLLSAGRDDHRTFLSTADGERVRTTWTTAAGSPHRIEGPRALTWVSPTGDLLLTAVRFVSPGIVPVRTRFPAPIPQATSGTVLAWRGRGGPVPLVSDGNRLLVQKVLAWSPVDGEVIVLGTAGERVGLFTFAVGAGTGPREARFLSSPRGPVGGATFLDDGTALIAIAGTLVRLGPSGVHEVTLPGSAPLPRGPVVWLPPQATI